MKQERLFELHAEVCKTLSNPVRLRIINELQYGEITVGSLAKKLEGMVQTSTMAYQIQRLSRRAV
jgi:DNA-binding transcriptional ArsR family regulator